MSKELSTWSNKISKRGYEAQQIRKANGQPIDPGDVYISPELTTFSVGFMQDSNMVSKRMAPSVPVAKQTGKYPTYPRSFWFRDEMKVRGDAQPSAMGTFGLTFDSFAAEVYSWKIPLGAQARANAQPLDLDQAGTRICTNKAILKREKLWFDTFFTTGVWTTQVQGASSPTGSQITTWKNSSATPIKNIKDAIRSQVGLTGGLYRANKAVFSADVWDAFCEHPNVTSRINAGQTPGGPAEATQQMVAGWLGLDEVIVANGIHTTSNEGAASDTYDFLAASGQILLAYVPKAPALFEPAAMYSFDWVPPGSMVGGYGNAVASWWDQNLKAQMYECEMATDQHLVSADCGILLYDLLA